MGIVERLRKMVDATQWEYAWQVERQQRLDIRQSADLIEKMGEVLKDNEWNGIDEGYLCCPDCGGRKYWPKYDQTPPVGHLPDCKLAACLKDLQ